MTGLPRLIRKGRTRSVRAELWISRDWEARIAGLKLRWAGTLRAARPIFEQRTCHACHTGSSRLGPDLKGAAARLSPQDLFLAIVDPNRDVSPAHQTQVVTTKSGETHTGVMIYDSPDGEARSDLGRQHRAHSGRRHRQRRPFRRLAHAGGAASGIEGRGTCGPLRLFEGAGEKVGSRL